MKKKQVKNRQMKNREIKHEKPLISEIFGNIGMFQFKEDLELYGTLLDGDYCLNWWQNTQANKIEMHLFTPLSWRKCDYKHEQNLLVERFEKSELVEKVARIGTKRIDIYLK